MAARPKLEWKKKMVLCSRITIFKPPNPHSPLPNQITEKIKDIVCPFVLAMCYRWQGACGNVDSRLRHREEALWSADTLPTSVSNTHSCYLACCLEVRVDPSLRNAPSLVRVVGAAFRFTPSFYRLLLTIQLVGCWCFMSWQHLRSYQSCDSTHSWWLYSAAPDPQHLASHSVTLSWHWANHNLSYPSDKCKSLVWLDREPNSWSSTSGAQVLPLPASNIVQCLKIS